MGFLAGQPCTPASSAASTVQVWGTGFGADQTSYYVGATVATPVTGLRLGAAFDYLNYRISGHRW